MVYEEDLSSLQWCLILLIYRIYKTMTTSIIHKLQKCEYTFLNIPHFQAIRKPSCLGIFGKLLIIEVFS